MARNSNIQNSLFQQLDEFSDVSPLMDEIGEKIVASILQNFRSGGRFGNDNEFGGGSQSWKVSLRAREWNGQTLIKSRQLQQSITYRASDNVLEIGSNKEYAAIHQFGGVIKHPGGTPYVVIDGKARFMRKGGNLPDGVKFTKPHSITIPARPFVVLQDVDIEDIRDIITAHYSVLLSP